MAKRHVIHPENCRNQVREQLSFCGITITLTGKYACEWSVMKEANGKITIETFPNRKAARKEFNKYR